MGETRATGEVEAKTGAAEVIRDTRGGGSIHHPVGFTPHRFGGHHDVPIMGGVYGCSLGPEEDGESGRGSVGAEQVIVSRISSAYGRETWSKVARGGDK